MSRLIRNSYFNLLTFLLTLAWLCAFVSAKGGGGGHGSSGGGRSGGGGRKKTYYGGGGGTSHGYDSDSDWEWDSDDEEDDPWFSFHDRSDYYYSGRRDDARDLVIKAIDFRRVHGVLASLAMVLLFPLGSIVLRLWTPKERGDVVVSSSVSKVRRAVESVHGFHVHVLVQVVGWMMWVAAAGLGIWLVSVVRGPRGKDLFFYPKTRHHPIIGIVVFALLLLQPIFGFLHHRGYKRLGRRTFWSSAHLFVGRVGVTLGIINGGLGLQVAEAETRWIIAYSVVAGVLWLVWMAVAMWSEIRRLNRRDEEAKLRRLREAEEDKPPAYA